jgi:hypothetical protein
MMFHWIYRYMMSGYDVSFHIAIYPIACGRYPTLTAHPEASTLLELSAIDRIDEGAPPKAGRSRVATAKSADRLEARLPAKAWAAEREDLDVAVSDRRWRRDGNDRKALVS